MYLGADTSGLLVRYCVRPVPIHIQCTVKVKAIYLSLSFHVHISLHLVSVILLPSNIKTLRFFTAMELSALMHKAKVNNFSRGQKSLLVSAWLSPWTN